MSQSIQPLNDEDRTDLDAKRKWVRDHYDDSSVHEYETLDGKLRVIDTILQNGWVAPDETLKLQCLGVTFGDALAQHVGMEWARVKDEYGCDPALVFPGTSVVLFPLTSISKRIGRGEKVAVYDLFHAACSTIERVRQNES